MTDPRRNKRATASFADFAERGVLAGFLLIAVTVFALAWANSPWDESYFRLWQTKLTVGLASSPVTASLQHWINDGLMAVFFLLVGLEIKRELLVGELSSRLQASLPLAAAVGGMLVPAALYTIVNFGGAGARGWGIPMATDIAFALGVLTMLGPRVPLGLKVFLTALAIVDDMGAVLVIALFYSSSIAWGAVGVALAAMAVLIAMNRLGVRDLLPYLIAGLSLWAALLASGIHATIAGVLLALAIPSRTRINALEFSTKSRSLLDDFDRSETGDLLVLTSKGQQEALYSLDLAASGVQAPLLRLEQVLHGPVSFLIMPLFALANAGVALSGVTDAFTDRVTIGVVLGLLVGKPAGVMLFSWLAVKYRIAHLPANVSWHALHGVAWLAGIGFTMSLFVGNLAFGEGPQLAAAKVGILVGSVVAGVMGWYLTKRSTSLTDADEQPEPQPS